ncbi:MAG: hemerythrin domain-containing protein [Actinomycetes bacterium]
MPDVVDVIKAQHRKINELPERAQNNEDETLSLLQQVSDILLPHSEAEESFVYPTIRNLSKEEGSEVTDGVAEHHDMERMLKELLQGQPGSPGYDGRLAAFVGELQHHVEEEEQDLLPVLSEKASDDDRASMGERFARETGDDDSSAPASESRSSRSSSDTESTTTESMTKEELYEMAKQQDVPGRSSMSKDELRDAVEGSAVEGN